jgi:hypothetical protein
LIRPLDRAQNFPKAVFLRLALEWLLSDEDVWSPVLEYRFKWAITIDPTVGSRSNISRSCFAWGSYGMATLCRGCLVART